MELSEKEELYVKAINWALLLYGIMVGIVVTTLFWFVVWTVTL